MGNINMRYDFDIQCLMFPKITLLTFMRRKQCSHPLVERMMLEPKINTRFQTCASLHKIT